MPSEKLTRNFLQNWGAPYKFAVNVHSRPFSEAPESIIGALKRMQWAGKQSIATTNKTIDAYAQQPGFSEIVPCDTLTSNFVDFNELLSIGYMEEDKISVSYGIIMLFASRLTPLFKVPRRRRRHLGTYRGYSIFRKSRPNVL